MSNLLSKLLKKQYIPLYICFILTLLLYGVIYLIAAFPTILAPLGIPEVFVETFVLIIPGPLWSDIILLYLFPLLTYLGIQYLSPYSTLFYTKSHKSFYILRTKPIYGIYQTKSEISGAKLLLRLLKGSFLCFVIASWFIQSGFHPYFRDMTSADPAYEALFRTEALFLATFFFTPLIILIYFPLWNLEDAGIIAYRKFNKKRKNPDIEGVNRIFRDFIEYFIGFTTIYVYFNRIYKTFVFLLYENPYGPDFAALFIPILLIFLPFLISGLFSIPMLLYEIKFKKNMNRIHVYFEMKDFSYIEIPNFENLVKERDIK
ncbi:MAG: hypothetical protein ACQERB_03865 [Promethearchaeati archaeon]